MVDIVELQSKLNKMLNKIDNPNNVRVSDYIDDVAFGVITYASYIDNISDIDTTKNVVPVYISEPSGTVEPIPLLGEINMQYSITVYFPITLKDKFFKLMSYFINVFAGRMIDFGTKSGNALCNLNVPTFNEIDTQEFKQFSDFMENKYKLPIMKSSMWGSYTFTLYLHQLDNLGKANGFILGNQIKYSLSFTYNNKTFTEDVILTSSARNYTADPVSQQIMGEYETLSLNKNSSYADSIQVYAKNNTFWNTFRDLFENGLLQDTTFILTKTYAYDNKSYTKELILVSCPQAIDFGSAITYTFAFTKKARL